MSIESAKSYINRMREDRAFHIAVEALPDEEASWSFVREQGYEFTPEEFRAATEEIYRDYGIEPM